MGRVSKKSTESESPQRKTRKAIDPQARENQLINLAMDEAERQISEGTASSQIITHFLKLGCEKERLEREKLEHENALLRAKKEMIESGKRIEALYGDAINAMKRYKGDSSDDDDE